jgi:hypothetical protein
MDNEDMSMKANERFLNLIRGNEIDRPPIIEYAPYWDKTITRWQKEGLPLGLDNPSGFSANRSVRDLQLYFGFDACIMTYISALTEETPKASSFGSGIMKTAADYQKIKQTLYPEPSSIFTCEYIEWLKSTTKEGNTIHWFMVGGFFWHPRELFGIEPHLFSFYDEPDLLKEMCRDHAEWLKKLFDYLGNTVQFDFMTFAEDMSYNHGPMLSKETFDEFIAPGYKELVPLVKTMNLPVFVDSDGDITQAVDWYAQAGAEGMSPLERQAGTDLAACAKKHPDMTFMGHFDKMCMKHGEAAMRKEFEYLIPYCRQNKVIISVDHQTPPDVSLENYRIYIKLYKEYAAKMNRVVQ